MMKIRIDKNSKVETIPLGWKYFNEEKYLVGHQQSGFVFVDRDFLRIIPFLDGQTSLAEIAQITTTAIDQIKIFVLTMIENNLIKKIDSHLLCKNSSPTKRPFHEYRLKDRLLMMTSSITAFLVLFLLILTVVLKPALTPKSSDFFWSNRQSFNLFTLFIFSLTSLVIHESFHFFSARFFDLKTSFSLSNRLFFVVAETKISNIYSLPKLGRIYIYLAGLFSEIILLYLLLLAKTNSPPESVTALLLGQFIIVEFISISWQFLIFMKTDLYYVFCELLKENRLQEKAVTLLRGNQPKDFKLLLYAFLFLFGTAVAVFRYAFFNLPIALSLLLNSFTVLLYGSLSSTWRQNISFLLDALIVFILESFYFSSLAIAVFKKIQIRRENGRR